MEGVVIESLRLEKGEGSSGKDRSLQKAAGRWTVGKASQRLGSYLLVTRIGNVSARQGKGNLVGVFLRRKVPTKTAVGDGHRPPGTV